MTTQVPRRQSRPVFSLPVQILLGVVLGLLTGLLWPAVGVAVQPLGTAFVSAVKMVVIPVVFCAVALGSMKMGHDAPRLGRVALIAFGWFYFASCVAIVICLSLNSLFHPGLGMHLAPPADLPASLGAGIDWTKFLLDLIPSNIVAS